MAGYSGTPLWKKLGIKPLAKVALVGAPDGFETTMEPMPDGLRLRRDLRARGQIDVIVYFAPSRAALQRRFGDLAGRLTSDGGLWVGWPKKSSGVPTDLSDG